MRNLFLNLIICTTFFVCNSVKSQNNNENIVKKYIEYSNTGNNVGIDSLLSKDFKFYGDTMILERDEFFSTFGSMPIIANFKRQIVKTEYSENIVITKEKMTDDYINNLNIEPMYRKREYHINENNKIYLIYNIETYVPKEYKSTVNNFLSWANENYKIIYDRMIELAKKQENYDNELNFLLAKIKNEGIEILEQNEVVEKPKANTEIKSTKTQGNKTVNVISTTMFSESIIGKTKIQIKQKYGLPCEAQTLSEFEFWYYGSMYCGENRTVIINVDSEKEVMLAQIQFSGNIATSVNFY